MKTNKQQRNNIKISFYIFEGKTDTTCLREIITVSSNDDEEDKIINKKVDSNLWDLRDYSSVEVTSTDPKIVYDNRYSIEDEEE